VKKTEGELKRIWLNQKLKSKNNTMSPSEHGSVRRKGVLNGNIVLDCGGF
jgi:hypothetical protein